MKIQFLNPLKIKLDPDEGSKAPSVQRSNPKPDHIVKDTKVYCCCSRRPSSDVQTGAPTADVSSKKLSPTDNKQTASK